MISFAITDEHVRDAKAGRELLTSVKCRINRLFGDKGYHSKSIYNTFGGNAIIPPRKNTSTKSRGSPSRTRIVRQIRRRWEKQWKESIEYGKSWYVEIYFSGLRSSMGEVIKAVRPDYIGQEIALEVQYYKTTWR